MIYDAREPHGIGIAFCMAEAAELTMKSPRHEDRKERKMNIKKLLVPAIVLVLGLAHAEPAVAAPTDTLEVVEKTDEIVTVRVVNHNWADMRIYVIVGGRSLRIGTVAGLTTETLKIHRSLIGFGADLELVAFGLGNRSAIHSGHVVVSPGDQLEFRVENTRGTSFLFRV